MNSIGHLFAASIINGGPAPAFLASWVYEYMSNGIKGALKSAPKMDDTSSLGNLYQKVILFSFFLIKVLRNQNKYCLVVSC